MPAPCAGAASPSSCSPCSRSSWPAPWPSRSAAPRGPARRAAPARAGARERGRAHHFDVRRIAERPQPADLRRRRARRRRAGCGCSSSPAASCASPAGGGPRCSTSPARCSPAPSRGCSASPSIPTSPRTGGSTCTGPTAAATRAWPSSARAPDGSDRPAARAAAAGRRPARGEPQRRPARLRPRRPALPRARRRRRRVRPARDRPGPALAARQADRHAGRRPAALADGPDRPAQPVALLLRRRAGRAVDRRRRAGRRGGGQPRRRSSSTSRPRTSAGARSRARERIAGHALDRGGRARVAGRRLLARGRLLGHRRRWSTAAAALPALSRRYVYGDFCAGALWSLEGRRPEGGATDVRRERATVPQLAHIGVDADGELLFASGAGGIYRAVAPRLVSGRDARWPARPATRARGRRDARRGSPSRRERSRTPSASSSCSSWSWPKNERCEHDRLGALLAHRAQADGRPTRAGRTTSTGPRTPVPGREAPERAAHDAAVGDARQHVDVAEELRDPAAAGPLVDLLGRAGLLDAPVAQHGDGVGERERLRLVVRDEQRARAGGAQDRGDLLAQALAQAGVERGERLVEQHDLGVGGERAGERDALALAARELVRVRARPGPRGRRARGTRRPRSRRGAPKPALAATVRCGNSAPCWKTMPTWRCSGSTHVPGPATARPPIAHACPRPGARSRRSGAAACSCPTRSARRSATSAPRSTRRPAPSTAPTSPNALREPIDLDRGRRLARAAGILAPTVG